MSQSIRLLSRSAVMLLPVALLALGTGCESFNNAFQTFSGNTPAFWTKMTVNPDYPDLRRQGIVGLVERGEFAHHPPYTTLYRALAKDDPDFLVRATAIRALNIARDRAATPVFVRGLNDPHDQIRLEAAKALANMPDPAAAPQLVKLVRNDDNRDVRIAAAEALQYYRNLEVARTLVNTLNGRDFGVAWQSLRSLTVLTGRNLQYDPAAWLAYLTGPEKPFG